MDHYFWLDFAMRLKWRRTVALTMHNAHQFEYTHSNTHRVFVCKYLPADLRHCFVSRCYSTRFIANKAKLNSFAKEIRFYYFSLASHLEPINQHCATGRHVCL